MRHLLFNGRTPKFVISSIIFSMLMVTAVPMICLTASAAPTPATIVIDGDADLEYKAGLYGWPGDGSAAHPYTIVNITFNGATDNIAVNISNTDKHILIENCTIAATCWIGLYISSSNNVVVANSTMTANGYPIRSDRSDGVVIFNSTIYSSNAYGGIVLTGTEGATIANCTVTMGASSSMGVIISGASANVLVQNNTITAQTGLYADTLANNVTIRDNIVNAASYGYGIYLAQSTYDMNIINNTVIGPGSGNGQCIFAINAVDLTVVGNDLSKCYFAVQATNSDSSGDLVISNNTMYECVYGIFVYANDGQAAIENNSINATVVGIDIQMAAHISGNKMTDCGIVFQIDEDDLSYIVSGTDVTSTNTINGLPVYSLKDRDMEHALATPVAGEVILLNVTGLVLDGIDVEYGGVVLISCTDVTVKDSSVTYGMNGIYIYDSSDCQMVDDTISSVYYGIFTDFCTGITIDSDVNSEYYGVLLYRSIGSAVVGGTISSENDIGVYLKYSSDVTVANSTVNGEDAGIDIYSSHDISIFNNTATADVSSGIYLEEMSYNNTVIGNIATGLFQGIDVLNAYGNVIANNTATGTVYRGILISKNAHDNVIANNTAIGDRNGILMEFCYDNIVANNTMTATSGFGILLTQSYGNDITDNNLSGALYGIAVSSSYQNRIANNIAECMGDTGLAISLSQGNEVVGNVFSGTTEGIIIGSSSNNYIIGNNVTSTNAGILIDSYSSNNYIIGNNATGSTYGIYAKDAFDNYIIGNNATGTNSAGIYLDYYSGNNYVIDNRVIGYYGICLLYSNGNLIVSNTANGTSEAGIDLEYSNSNEIVGNDVTGANEGINCYLSSGNTISDNDATGTNRAGIFLDYNSCNNEIVGNDAVGPSGIYVRGSTDDVIAGNTVNGTDIAGIYLDGDCYDCDIIGNDVTGRFGIYLSGSSSNLVANNTITDVKEYGIMIVSSSFNTVTGNTITNSTSYGIYLSDCTENEIFGNILIGNNGTTSDHLVTKIQAYDDGSNIWNNTSFGNYWGDWTVPDADGNGIVDLPYEIDGGAEDALPVTISMSITTPASTSYTGSQTMIVSGTAADGFGITVIAWYNEATGSSGACSGTSSWTANVALTEGMNNITVTMVDSIGTTLSSNITVFFSSGITVVMAPSSGSITYTTDDSIAVSFNITDAVAMTTGNMSHYVNGVLVDSRSTNVLNGLRSCVSSFDMDLEEGTNVFYFTANDTAGNSVTKTLTVISDTVAPSVSITSPAINSYNNTGSVNVAWAGSDATSGMAYYNVSVYDGSAWSNYSHISSGVTSKLLTGLSDGVYTVYVEAVDIAGNTNRTSSSFTVDTVGPSISVTSPAINSYNNTGSVTIKWAASNYNVVEISTDGTTWTAVTGSSCTLSGLSDGVQTVHLKAIDIAGNMNETSVVFIVDRTAPSVSIGPLGSTIYNGTVTIRWTAGDATGIAATKVSTDGTTWTTITGSSYVMSGLSDGTYTFHVQVTDIAGNVNETSVSFKVVLPGELEGYLVDGKGNVVAGAKVALSNGLTATTDAKGYFIFENITAGSYTMTVEKDGYKNYTATVTAGAGELVKLGSLKLSENGESSSSDDNGTMWIGLAVAAIAIIAVSGFLLLRMRQKK